MNSNFQVEFRISNGNMHIMPSGDFDGGSAWQLINLLHEKYNGEGRIFIDTSKLGNVYPFGCSTFQCRLNPRQVPFERLFFKGEKGFKIAPDGSKVIVAPKNRPCRCGGDCENCPCAKKKRLN